MGLPRQRDFCKRLIYPFLFFPGNLYSYFRDTTLADLLSKARKGDRDSILKLIQIDKSLVTAKWSAREIRKAQMAGDLAYFTQLADALKTDAFKAKKKNYRLSCVLVYCWNLGLNKLTVEKICDLVRDMGIFNGDANTLHREINRLGLKKNVV